MNKLDISKNKQLLASKDEELWTRIMKTHISDTAKDFTIMLKIQTRDQGVRDVRGNQMIVKENGKEYLVTIGVVDLDFKLYTKLEKYNLEWM